MDSYFTKITDMTFENAIQHITQLLKDHGFGIITEIDVTQTLKNKIDADFRPYRILGACNPVFAHKALQLDDKAGIMMPCNVIVQQLADGRVEITLINPEAAAASLKSKALVDFACKVTEDIRRVYSKI